MCEIELHPLVSRREDTLSVINAVHESWRELCPQNFVELALHRYQGEKTLLLDLACALAAHEKYAYMTMLVAHCYTWMEPQLRASLAAKKDRRALEILDRMSRR